MTTTITVGLGERSYEIHVGTDVPIGADMVEGTSGVLLVSDSNVAPHYSRRCVQQLEQRGMRVAEAVVPAGEPSKSLQCAETLYNAAVEAGLDRQAVVVALGGGMVGDLAGFVAATYLRGVRLIQVPTSLLAMVDSSVGGKTAVNLPRGKNLVGVFHQPVEVVADLATLTTLPEREYRSGLAEVVKYGVIWSTDFVDQLERDADRLLARETAPLQSVVARCCEIKAKVVVQDERESGVRAFLNFGHTCGHALEQVSGYGRWLHGEAVSLGMVYALRLSVSHQGCPATDADRIVRLLERLGLPIRLAESRDAPAWDAVWKAMAADKKNRDGVPRWVLAPTLGTVQAGYTVPEEELEVAWRSIGGR